MPEQVLATEHKPLSQIERVVDVFVAPSKTFTDILRDTSWWLPFVLAVIVTLASSYAIDKKIGFPVVAEQAIAESPSTVERMDKMPPEQRAAQMQIMGKSYRFFTYGSSVFLLILSLIGALINWASFNFGLGARTTFSQNLAVWMYASLPRLFVGLLNVVLLFAGANTENFNLKNPVGTNVGYYLQDAAPWLKTAGSFLDIFGLWTLVLTVIGMSIIAKKSKGQAAAIVVGWWFVILVVVVGITAATS